jgi:Domain of unknown function (DUF5615)
VVRLLVDAHLSGRRIGAALRERGHDVRAADDERALDGCEDERLLELARAESRITVTFNVRDFARIANDWTAGGRHHSGCILLVGMDHSEFGLIVRVIDASLDARPEQTTWQDHVAWGTRAVGG